VNPREVLQAKYPAANLAVYFAFIEMCRQFEPEPQKRLTHEHHICPRKQFPEYAEGFPENLITLRTHLHMHAHKLLTAAVPELCNITPWIKAGAAVDHAAIGRHAKENGTGIFAPGMQAKGGRKGGRKHKENSTGIFAPGMQAKGGHTRWHVKRGIVNPTCSLCRL
jgi:hypothetical protein